MRLLWIPRNARVRACGIAGLRNVPICEWVMHLYTEWVQVVVLIPTGLPVLMYNYELAMQNYKVAMCHYSVL
jgi:hypothetical protein